MTDDGGPEDILNFVESCANAFSKKALDDGKGKIVRFSPEQGFKNSAHGWMRYGSYGYGSQVEDIKTGEIALNRATDQADTIPLYYRVWCPPKMKFGLMALQSFGGKSCAEIVQRALIGAHQNLYPDHRITMTKLMPNDMKLYGSKIVRQIHLVKKNASQDNVEAALRPQKNTTKIDIQLSLKARSGGSFGRLKDLGEHLKGHLEISDIEFEGAYGEVLVGKSYRKIGVIGVNNNAGVIDVSNDIERDGDEHPTLKSIKSSVTDVISDFAQTLGA
ncbi:hypothetical protein [Antarctobacter jejuensis]|uniref:hypothetical protein n=1 Tax=Antarctobacter jejuensis TaxID=1439938 RepID=UPI003FD35C12